MLRRVRKLKNIKVKRLKENLLQRLRVNTKRDSIETVIRRRRGIRENVRNFRSMNMTLL
jgi:hypothetical protein